MRLYRSRDLSQGCNQHSCTFFPFLLFLHSLLTFCSSLLNPSLLEFSPVVIPDSFYATSWRALTNPALRWATMPPSRQQAMSMSRQRLSHILDAARRATIMISISWSGWERSRCFGYVTPSLTEVHSLLVLSFAAQLWVHDDSGI